MLPRIVSFIGPIGAGKTTASDVLTAHLGYKKVSFADPLKGMLMRLGLEWDNVYGETKEKAHPILCGRTPRYAMQTLGTEWGRHAIHPDLWVRAWQFQIQPLQFVTVDDLRFENEYKMVRSLNGVIIKIHRDVKDRKTEHESETFECPVIDNVINNLGQTVTEFRREVVRVVKGLSAPNGLS